MEDDVERCELPTNELVSFLIHRAFNTAFSACGSMLALQRRLYLSGLDSSYPTLLSL